ncbi:MAG: cation-translocating P-type ATPase [Opitutaceae bacterium]|nr:cation-translocating P-type ATPase [Opitutaceae bacterium]
MSEAAVQVPEPGLQADQRTLDRAWLRIGAGAVIAAQGMVFTFALNLGEEEAIDLPRAVVHGLLIASAFGSLAFLGGDLVRESVGALRARRVTVDLLFLVTLLGALVGSLMSTFRGVGEVYYEVVAILIVVHTLGRMLGARSRVAALRSVQQMRQEFSRCRVVRADGSEEIVPYTAVREGDQVRVLPSEKVPVDGTIVKGVSDVEESAMTGEWRPVRRGAGDSVQAGSHVLDGELVVKTRGGVRQVDQILEAVERAQLAPSRIQAQADRLTTLFLPLVLVAAVGTGVAWSFWAPWDVALFRAMAVLLVACPCAMGLATPVAIWGALASLARIGIIARSGDFVDQLAHVDTLFLDKTGTLSSGELRVGEWRWENPDDQMEIQRVVASLEAGLVHPIARALSSSLQGVGQVPVDGRALVPGEGVKGGVANVTWAVGSDSLGRGTPADARQGKWVHVFRDGAWKASAQIVEDWREGLPEALVEFRRQGLQVEVLSGDPQAREVLVLDLPVHAGLRPEDKVRRVKEARASGRRVLLVGDGINDAEAMSAATVAIAMVAGTDLARAASAAVHRGARIDNLPLAIELARRARTAVNRNLVFAFGYNVIGMAFAAFGWLHPVAAALLMVGSSAIVSVSALRAVRVEPSRR